MGKSVEGRAKGGIARAEKLSAEERKKISRKALDAKADLAKLPKATHGSADHPLKVGDIEIPCYVLENDVRVLSQRGLQAGIGMSLSGGKAGEQRIAAFLETIEEKGINIKGLSARIRNPIRFRQQGGGREVYGFEATILADICDVVLAARKAGALHLQQNHIAEQCEILVRGFARVGIIALVDEATGYQRDRAKDALAKILEAFIAKELQPWVQTFPTEYYQELFRLRGLDFRRDSVRRPQYFGNLTNDIVYKRLAPGVLDELKRITPRDEVGRLKAKYFQRLTNNTGYPKLREHLGKVVMMMQLSATYEDFKEKLDRFLPKKNTQLPLFLEQINIDDEDDGKGI